MTAPVRAGVVHGDQDLHIELAAPSFELPAKQNIIRPPRAVKQYKFAELLALGSKLIERWSQWRQAQPAGDHNNVPTIAVGHRPGGAIWPSEAKHCASRQSCDGFAHLSDRAHRL